MKLIYTSIILAWFTMLSISGSSQENPVNADMVVAADGSGDFTSIQAAIDAAPANSERRTVIYIKRGLYNTEKLIIPGDKINLTLIGESREETIISYHIYDCANGKCPVDDAALWTGDNIRTSATLTILSDGFRAENMTIQNTAGPVGQAQAITIRSDKCIFINVDFYGYQDTMYFWSNGKRSYFKGCLVVGRTDYIYGGGTVFFQDCEIRSWGGGWITAPSTGKTQPYGYVFNECQLTYAVNSPRGGDDGALVRLGRPWHNYPKVTWLNCEMTDMIHPQGWGDKWNMDYADTSEDLHLYEYKNTGPGADMSQRANWAGLKELTDEEALDYTVQKVLTGNDGWDPTAEISVVQTYQWTGNGNTGSWKDAQNWNPEGIPSLGELAEVDGAFVVIADGDTFPADLILKNKAVLDVSQNSVATYISVRNAIISSSAEVSLNGKIATKDSIFFTVEGILNLDAELTGIHPLTKTSGGKLTLNTDNSNFSGNINIAEGAIEAGSSGSLGKSSVFLPNGSTLIAGHDNAFHAKSKLKVETGALLVLNADIITSEFYIDEQIQNVGEYDAESNSGLISGEGKIIVGRPEIFTFHRGANGNWDNPAHFSPSLVPQAGETVIVEEEMETTSTVFGADIIIRGAGNLRLRGNHTCTGTITMENGTSIKYNTGGIGMALDAPVAVAGNVILMMESDNNAGSTMTLSGPISGSVKVTALNNGKGTVNEGKLLLTGDNSGFSGTWDLSVYSQKYPSVSGYVTTIEGNSENAFGKGKIVAELENKVIFSHSKAAGDSLVLTLNDDAKAVLNATVHVKKMILNGISLEAGEYSEATHLEFFEGVGKIMVGESGGDVEPDEDLPAFPGAEGHGRYVTGGRGGQVIYVTNLEDNSNPGSLRWAVNQSGPRIILFKVSGTIQLKSRLNISKGDITIAGQTAPGDGITLRDYPVVVKADNVIIRYLRFRMGDAAQQEADALEGREVKNVIIDHCSMSWSTDECVSFYHNENTTVQWCIISESLRNSVHGKGSHGYGGIWGGENASFHHNLLAHHDSRNPRLGEKKGEAFALTDLVDLRNNVIYNWMGNSAYGAEAMNVNIVNCYYKPGPATTKKERIISIDKLTDPGYAITNIWGKFYIDGNVLTASERATNDNWTYGVYNQFHSKYTVTATEKEAMRLSEPLNPGKVTTHTAETAYEKVLDFAGASLVTDSVDKRIIHDVSTGTATFMDGGNGSKNGIIDTQDAVNGWPALQTLGAPVDSDEDGMPDDWEIANGLNPYDAADAQLTTVDGKYPNVEVYINSLVAHITGAQNQDAISTSANSIFLNKKEKENINVYFSNTENRLVISHKKPLLNVVVYGITGQQLLSRNENREQVRLDISGLKSGIYIVSVRDAENRKYSEKFIKR
ncbi:MAG: T9SS type A sorting domain-containing protein [Mariniphaga sp.]|nr:T9SS type A sorting domain-containing protein [Mariniphaga sp.]